MRGVKSITAGPRFKYGANVVAFDPGGDTHALT